MSELRFTKMHGLGNDFVVIDARAGETRLGADQLRALAARRTGVGCDQIITLEPACAGGDLFMRIHNADGGEVAACGNGARCVARVVMDESGAETAAIETGAGMVRASRGAGGAITVDMGAVHLDWREIPLARETDTLEIDVAEGPLARPTAVNVGNPHAVFFVADVEAVPLAEIGPILETHDMFPERANIEAVQVLARDRLRVRVWERGAGITRACGTGACAALVAASRRDLTDRKAEVVLDGGSLQVAWRDDGHVAMTGPTATVFSGVLDTEDLA